MKIRSVDLTNFRKFVGTVRVENIGDKVNVLVGRNELGKSTLLEAINAVIFEKAKSMAANVKAFRHFVNGTVPEVKLTFELDGKTWTIHKRFAGQAGKATLTCSDKRIFLDEAAEAELQKILGFTAGARSAEPGIWGTLWVQQGKSFGDDQMNEQAQQTMLGCLESQIGVVTGGARGQKIPRAVRDALEALCSTRGPRGKYKETIDLLAECKANVVSLEDKSKSVFRYMTELAEKRHQLKETTDGWDDSARRSELEVVRLNSLTAAKRAAEIDAAEQEATLGMDRAAQAHKQSDGRIAAVAEIDELERSNAQLKSDHFIAETARNNARADMEAGEDKVSKLRSAISGNGEKARKLERLRSIVQINLEIEQHDAVIAKSALLQIEAQGLSEKIGAISTTDTIVSNIEDALSESTAAAAAMSAVATLVSFAVRADALQKVHIDEKRLDDAGKTISILEKTTLTLEGFGKIAIDPQVKDRASLIRRQGMAEQAVKHALEEAGVADLAAARTAASERKDYLNRSKTVERELSVLAPGIASKKISAGIEPLKSYVAQLRGRLSMEMEKQGTTDMPAEVTLSAEIARNHTEAERLALEVATAAAELAGPLEILAQVDEKLRSLAQRFATSNGALESKKTDLRVGREAASDAQLLANGEALETASKAKLDSLASLREAQGESVEALAARAKRLENAMTNHQRSMGDLKTEVTRLKTLVEANEGAGAEELLLIAQAERDRLESSVAEYEREVEVLQLLLGTLDTAESEAKTFYLAPVVRHVEPYLRMLLPGTEIILDEALNISSIKRDGQNENFSVLSGGTREQLAILTRLAFAELLLKQKRPATVILDDALAFSDDDRIESMFDILMRAGDNVQILVLTCRKKLFSRLGAAPVEIREIV